LAAGGDAATHIAIIAITETIQHEAHGFSRCRRGRFRRRAPQGPWNPIEDSYMTDLFTPFDLNGVELPNRILMSAMTASPPI